MERYICIHGHFYQPPRENPSLEAVELQDSAYPFHDWNERVTMECYEPNAASRILDDGGHIVRIVNNYEKISYDFNPTLLSWLQTHEPAVYETLLASDRVSQEIFSGHGSALAQPYNHVILPLASERDRRTLIRWGIRDFVLRFEREPEGLWLPEMAVDLATLELVAEAGIQFTVLSQSQAARLRRLGDHDWQEVSDGQIDPTTAYQLSLPSGRRLAIFFYDSLIAHAIAFEGLLASGEELARRLESAFTEERSWPQLVHVANDGEIYGHHHRHGDMALAYALQHIEQSGLARLTNYGEFLEHHPPQHEVQLLENTCWSCPHGLERWQGDCGCGAADHPTWSRGWRAPLRGALDWLRDELAARYEAAAVDLLLEPWEARDDYIEVLHDRSPAGLDEFFRRHASHQLQPDELTTALKLLESQRQALVMYTSSGWYFDDISALESTQAIRYAGRALQLAEQLGSEPLEAGLLERLAQAQSNIPEHQDGAQIYRQWVKPSLVDLEHVCAHFAMNSLFETYGEQPRVHCYRIERETYQLHSSGRMRLALGRARVFSEITLEAARFEFVVLHMGDHNLIGSVRRCSGEEQAPTVAEELVRHFSQADLAELVRAIDHHFSQRSYSLKRLFRDEQRRILATILDATLADAEAVYRQVYEKSAQMMGFLADIEVPMPQAWQVSAELVINSRLRQAFASEEMDPQAVRSLVAEANRWQVPLDSPGLAYTLRQTIEGLVGTLADEEEPELEALQRLEAFIATAQALPFEVDLRKVQNLYYGILQQVPAGTPADFLGSYDEVLARLNQLVSLGERLGIHTAEVVEVKENLINRASRIRELADQIAAERRIPRATYRVQFTPKFTFRHAQELTGYLDELGVSDLYASPLLKAGVDSVHGYDICDHGQLNPRLGGGERFDELSTALRERQMGLLLDLVPNHMGIGDVCNSWWLDVLENGPSSPYAVFFDIDWHPVTSELENKVLLPILEDQFGKVLENGTFRLDYADGCFFVHHYEIRLPLAPRSYSQILAHQLSPLASALGEDNPHVIELQSILTALSYLPQRTELAPEKIAERSREVHVVKGRIAALYQASSYVRAAIDAALEEFNGTPGDPHSFDLLEALLNDQAFRPAFWRVAADEINYRRFFDINNMAAIRPERHAVFHATHELVLQLLAERKVTGLRIDHPDGLWDPPGYFRQLQEHYVAHTLRGRLGLDQPGDPEPDDLEQAVSAWFADRFGATSAWAQPWPLYVVVEKILSQGERLHADWAVDGTTGYDFVNDLNGIFVATENVGRFDAIYASRAHPDYQRFHDLTNATKKMIMLVSLASEINTLGHRLERVAEKNRLYRDFTLNSLIFTIREIMAALPVYRTYTTDTEGVADQDRQHIETAVAEAKRRNPRTAAAVFDFIRDTLLLENLSDFPAEEHQELLEFVMKFQQVSGPAMAKGVEDTAFYVYNRLVSLNEVGGHPEHFGHGVAELHQSNLERAQRWPHAMLATSTHDTKRSADVRARINVLSELADEWATAVQDWEERNAASKTLVNGEPAPDRNDEYLLYQTLLGAWPEEELDPTGFADLRGRVADYMRKATKEAKVHTSWINANQEYDDAVQQFIASILAEQESDCFVSALRPLQRRVAHFGRFNALSQTLLKLTAPGVPDIYQGDELWDYSLVDPDNRRPVDYHRRRSLLGDLRGQVDQAGEELAPLASELLQSVADGRIKLYLIWRALELRRQHPKLFAEGGYHPVETSGAKAKHVVAFRRATDGAELIAVVPRLVVGLLEGQERPPIGGEVWGDTRLSLPEDVLGRGYRELYTGTRLAVGKRQGEPGLALSAVLSHFPVALLYRT